MQQYNQGELLKNVNYPEDIKKLSKSQLPQLCNEVRSYIIDVLAKNPGHLGSSLGTVELTIALHYVYDIPVDSLIWDVGHQAYSHKLITGRKDKFHTIRKLNGLSGFPKIEESKYDCFGTGHSSTSISAILGMAMADKLNGNKKSHHIAVIGDGSMTGGMVFEALNHAGTTDVDMLVILNDNGISIDKKVGAMGEYFTLITTSPTYNRIKNKLWNMLGGNSSSYHKPKTLVNRVLFATKSVFSGKSNFFEALRIRYFGPIKGNDVLALVKTLEDLKKINGPKILHIITKKGKGLKSAEDNPITYHAPGVFNPKTGQREQCDSGGDDCISKFQDVFGDTLVELGEMNQKIVGITPAMLSGCSMNKFMERFPERCFDVGIAEQHAVCFSAGLAANGLIPFCNVYSSFLQRAYDQIIHDIALQNLPVILCLDRAGLVGEDGATHHGVFDLAYLRAIPNLTIFAPLNESELRNIMYTAQKGISSPMVIRYPRGKGYLKSWRNEFETIEIGKGEKIRDGKDIAILSLGAIGINAIIAANELAKDSIEVAIYNMRFLKPMDTVMLEEVFASYDNIITIEDGAENGGFGSAVSEYAIDKGYKNSIFRMGIKDEFIEHGSVSELQKLCKIDSHSLVSKVKEILSIS
ncbi:MAG: 1-deoxy-D-xylulose-5-phosphate synthase [Bacteroidales bacterium]|nr:1-deoxy-D-xylulose-5-phosphate synthase [Bacteroidales bacterium]MDD4684646.1 1-deoxy-D-xylulose-5-phosphate synthase [Bacteroidales bacterium]